MCSQRGQPLFHLPESFEPGAPSSRGPPLEPFQGNNQRWLQDSSARMLVVAACGWGGEAGLSVRRAIRAQKLGQAHALYTKAQHAPAGLHTARHAAPLACDGSRLRSVGGVRAFLPEVGNEAMVPTAVEIAGEIAGETAGESSASPSEPRTSTRSVVAQSTGQRPKRTRSCPQCPPWYTP